MIEPKTSVVPSADTFTDASARCPVVQWKRVSSGAMPPVYQSEGSAGMDLSACVECKGGFGRDEIRIEPGAIAIVPTGWSVAIPSGYEGQIRPRSGLATKYGVTVPNAPGTIDSDYRGELKVALINLGKEAFVVTNGMRIAQLVIAPVARAEFLEVLDLDETRRGGGGFGSTGL